MQAIGYCRVSTREQGLSRNGLEGQREEIRRFASANCIELIDIVEEVASGSLGDEGRPVLAQAVTRAKASHIGIIVSKLDRFSRSVSYVSTSMEVFKRAKVPFYSAELGIDVDPFLMHLYASLAEKERLLIGQRTKAGLAQVKARGVLLGNRTNLVEAQAKGKAKLQAIADQWALGIAPLLDNMQAKGMTQTAMALSLNSYGTPTSKGGKWSQTLVQRTLARLQDIRT